jgi:uncharacterized RDD family membrane protein YckC
MPAGRCSRTDPRAAAVRPRAPSAEAQDARSDSAAPDGGDAGSVHAVSPEAPESEAAAPADPAPPTPDPASSQADAPAPPRLPRALPDGGPGRSSALAEMARPSVTPAARPAPALVGPRPAPAIVRARPDAGARAEPRPSPPSPVPAGFGRRAAAGLLDALLVLSGQLLLASPVLYYWYENWWSNPPTTATDVAFWPILVSLTLGPVVLALGAVYYVYHWGVKGATPGKRLLGLAVVAEDGSAPIGLSRAAVRVLGYLLSSLTLGIGFLMIAFGGSALHDRLAGTRVVRRERG